MAFGKSMLAAGILIVAGFGGGFLLSNGSGQILGMKPPHKASTKKAGGGSNANEVAAAAIVNAADADGDGGESGKHPTINQHGGGGGEGSDAGAAEAGAGAAAAGDGSGAGSGQAGAEATGAGAKSAGAAGAGTVNGGAAPGLQQGQTVALAGAQAAAFLTGNTVDASLPKEEPRLTYYSPRGLRADGHEGSFLVKPWNPKATSLCEPGSDGVLVCRPIQVRGQTGEHAPGAHIGMLLVAGDRWVPIYKGDRLGLPDHIPFVDSTVADAEPSVIGSKLIAKGQPALSALIGHAAAIDPPEGATDQPVTIVYLSEDGHRVTLTRPDDGADLADGITVSVGRWTVSKGVFCQSEERLSAVQACFKPEAWSKTRIRLVSTRKAPDLQLTILTETPRPHLEAAN